MTSWKRPDWLSYGRTRGSLEASFMDLFQATDSMFEAIRCNVASGNVSSFIDFMDDSHLLSQGTAGNRCPAPTTQAVFNGAPGCAFSSKFYDSNRAASAWRFLHDGSDCEQWVVFAPTNTGGGVQMVCSTCRGDATAGDIGYEIGISGTSALCANINETATPLALVSVTQAVNNVGMAYGFRGGTAQATDGIFAKGAVTMTSANYGSAVNTGNPVGTLRLGGGVDGSRLAAMVWGGVYTFHRVLSVDERTLVLAYIRARFTV